MGSATYYNGQTFAKINTGMSNPSLADVWGDEGAAYAVGTGNSPQTGTDAVFITGSRNNWQIVNKYDVQSSDPPPVPFQYVGSMISVFRANRESKLWLLGGSMQWQLFQVESLSPFAAKKVLDLPSVFPAFLIRGSADNDLCVASQGNGVFYHFNGKTWYRYEPPIKNSILSYFAIKGKTWVAVGVSTADVVGKAIVVVGKHM